MEVVRDLDALAAIRRRVVAAANEAAIAFRATASGDGIAFLRRIKFDPCGQHPLGGKPHNLVEQVNQTFTCLVTLAAAAQRFELHPHVGPLRLNMGTAAGSDIEDEGRAVFAAEVFAATHHQSNNKLAKDIAKVMRIDVPHCYVFFATPKYSETVRLPKLETHAVQVWSVAIDDVKALSREEVPSEMEILTAWALRLDGYRFETERDFPLAANADRFVKTGELPNDPLPRLAILFALQRWLGKWGGEHEPTHGRAWRRFRELFLRTHAIAVPEGLRLSGSYDEWVTRWFPHADADIETIWRVHSTTRYDDDAKPML